MATIQMASNNLVTCPYDKAHKMKESRFQMHISKCRLNNLHKVKEACPFNAQHLCDKGELEHHLSECTERSVLDKQLVASAENSSYKGHTGVPAYNSQPIKPEESWDNEMASRPEPSYRPRVEPPKEGIKTDFGLQKPAERKNYYQSLHHRNDDEYESSENAWYAATGDLPELRSPTTQSYVQVLDEKEKVHELKNIGLGRGHSAVSSCRIAANIYGQQAASMRQPRTTPNIPGLRSASLGMGRGGYRPNGDSQPVGSMDEINFHEVGFGRGAKKD